MTITTVWRVRGEYFDVDVFLHDYPEIAPSLIWKKGTQIGKSKAPERDSGANVPFCEKDSLRETMAVVRRWLVQYEEMLSALQKQGAESILDFGVYVGSKDEVVARVELDPHEMTLLARAGVGIAVSAYPCSDEC